MSRLTLSSPVLSRYTKTLFLLAKEQNCLPAIAEDMSKIEMIFGSTPGLSQYLSHPLLPTSNLHAIWEKCFDSQTNPLTIKFIRFLESKKRITLLTYLPTSFRNYYEEYQGIVRGVVRSVLPLSAAQMQAIKEKLQRKVLAKELHLVNTLEPKLIAGFQIQIGDMVIEANVQNKIQQLKQRLAA